MKADRTVRLAWTCAAVCAAIAALLWWNRNPAPLPAPRLARFTFDAGVTTWPAISADGRMVAYASDRDGGKNLDLYVQPVGGGQAVRLTQTPEDESEPDFSPDGGTIAYRSERDGGGIWTVPVAGGHSRLLVQGGHNPRYSPDGKWIAFGTPNSRIFVVASAGGEARSLSFPEGRNPAWSPDGHLLIFMSSGKLCSGSATTAAAHPIQVEGDFEPTADDLNWTANGLIYSSRDGWVRNAYARRLDAGGKSASAAISLTNGTEIVDHVAASRTGRVAFASGSQRFNRWALPVDTNTAKVTGAMVRVTDDFQIANRPQRKVDGLLLSPDGKLRYAITESGTRRGIQAVPAAGGAAITIYDSDTPRLSLGGVNPAALELAIARDKIVMILAEQTSNIWLMDLAH